MKIEIDKKHIEEAEKFLINGKKFDDESDGKKERTEFINNLKTCDLLAVPGSGKTTALMAKLYCLSKQLPFDDGSGILVLAHTNAAVNEIEKKLKKHCPNLFEYPNFVGTIQSFVNKFLANQACFEKYGSYIKRNDDDIYRNEVNNFFYKLKWNTEDNPNKDERLKNKLYGKANYEKDNSITTSEKTKNTLDYIYYLELDLTQRKFIYGDKKTTLYKYGGVANDYYLELEKWKEDLYKKGILNYTDSFSLSNWFLNRNSQIKTILQKRFQYVFIDEMQDLSEFQIKIIDDVFLNSSSFIQRIGDINQSIYKSGKKVKIECDWKSRDDIYLTNSNRLTKSNAEFVNYFTLDSKEGKFNVSGKRIIENGDIRPHLILFNKETKSGLKDKFEEIIKSFNLHKLPEIKDKNDEKEKLKIIGWNGEWDSDEDHKGKLRLKDIFPEYSKELKAKKEYLDSLSKYLQLFDQEKETLEAVRKSILNALTTVLYYQEKRFSISQLMDFIKNYKNVNDTKVYEDFKLKLYLWSFKLATLKNYETVFNSIKKFIETDFKDWFNFELNIRSKKFISNFKLEIATEKENTDKTKINIDIATVHSVKGQTHIATMYVETSYYEYETQKAQIKDVLLRNSHTFKIGEKNKGKSGGEKDARGKEALKMMYVGFSRPTHLLCFAVLEGNINDDELKIMKEKGWEIDSDLATIDVKAST